jgi:hypothetical protein
MGFITKLFFYCQALQKEPKNKKTQAIKNIGRTIQIKS